MGLWRFVSTRRPADFFIFMAGLSLMFTIKETAYLTTAVLIIFFAVMFALQAGYATAGTDDGHIGGTAIWAPGHHQKIIDFGFRALKETTDAAKAVIAAFYGKGPDRSYFVGCSDGGREALMEAQRFPDDFDGIVAGAPANDWTHLFSGFIFNEQALFANPASTIPIREIKCSG